MSKKHALIMVACCLVPIVGFALVSVFNVPLKSVLTFAILLFCPLSHLLMMKYMGHGNDHKKGMGHHEHPKISQPGDVPDQAGSRL